MTRQKFSRLGRRFVLVGMSIVILNSQGTDSILHGYLQGPAFSINDASVTEGNSGTVNMIFTITLSQASTVSLTVNATLIADTATADVDYEGKTTNVFFAPGDTSKPVTVVVKGDTLIEPNETFFIDLYDPTPGTTIGRSRGIGTIMDDDGPALSISDLSLLEGNTGTSNAIFTVTLSPISTQIVTVDYATAAGGTASASSDYGNSTGTLIFGPGDTSKPVSIPVNGDTLNEPNETFFVNLSVNPSIPTNARIADSQGTGTITNDDPLPTLSINDLSPPEGNTGTSNAIFTVTLSAISGQDVTVNYVTAVGGTASASSDYGISSGTLTFASGETSKPVPIPLKGDTLNEANETFLVNLSVPTNATIADSQGIGTIMDDDPLPTLSINDVSLFEGHTGRSNAIFTVTLSATSGQIVRVNYATAVVGGTASASSDYDSSKGLLTFPLGTTSQTVPIVVNGDTLYEPNETFFVDLSNPTNATIADSQGIGTITNDDKPPKPSAPPIKPSAPPFKPSPPPVKPSAPPIKPSPR